MLVLLPLGNQFGSVPRPVGAVLKWTLHCGAAVDLHRSAIRSLLLDMGCHRRFRDFDPENNRDLERNAGPPGVMGLHLWHSIFVVTVLI
jgi:hypothetical protein